MSGAERTQAHFKLSGGAQKRASETSRYQRFHSLLAVTNAPMQVEGMIKPAQISGQVTTFALESSPAGQVLQPGQSEQTSAAEPHGIPEPPGAVHLPFSTSLELADPRLANLAFRSKYPPRTSIMTAPECSNVLPNLSTKRSTIGPGEGTGQKPSGEARTMSSRVKAEHGPSRETKLQGSEGFVSQTSKTDGPGSRKGVDAALSRRTRPPPSERAQRQAGSTSDIDSGIREPVHRGIHMKRHLVEHWSQPLWMSAKQCKIKISTW